MNLVLRLRSAWNSEYALQPNNIAERKVVIEIQALKKEAADEIEKLRDLLVCITHHDGAINEYELRWLPVVQAELARRIRDEA